MSNKKKFFVIFLFIILDAFLLIGYLFINEKVNQGNFKKEISNLEKLDASTDRYNRQLKTTGEYRKAEKAVKKYLDTYAVDYQEILSMYKDSQLNKVLSYENISKDGFEFNESFKYLEEEKENFNKKIDSLLKRSDTEEFKSYLKSSIKDKEVKKLTLELVLSEDMTNDMNTNKDNIQKIKDKVDSIIDNSKEVLNLLKDNKEICSLEDNQIKIKSKQVIDRYNELISKIKEA